MDSIQSIDPQDSRLDSAIIFAFGHMLIIIRFYFQNKVYYSRDDMKPRVSSITCFLVNLEHLRVTRMPNQFNFHASLFFTTDRNDDSRFQELTNSGKF